MGVGTTLVANGDLCRNEEAVPAHPARTERRPLREGVLFRSKQKNRMRRRAANGPEQRDPSDFVHGCKIHSLRTSSGARTRATSGKPIVFISERQPGSSHRIEEGSAFNDERFRKRAQLSGKRLDAAKHDLVAIAGAMNAEGIGGCGEMRIAGWWIHISTGANISRSASCENSAPSRVPSSTRLRLYEQGYRSPTTLPATCLSRRRVHSRLRVRSKLEGPSTTWNCTSDGADLLKQSPDAKSIRGRAAQVGVPIYTSSPGDSSIGMNIAYHELLNGSTLMIDPNKDVNEVCAIILAGKRNGCVILGGGSPKNFYLQGQPTLWEVYGIQKGGNDYFIQITTDSVVWGYCRARRRRGRGWGKVNPGVLLTGGGYCDSTIAFPRFANMRSVTERQRAAQRTGPQTRRHGRRTEGAGTAATKTEHEHRAESRNALCSRLFAISGEES